MIRIVALIFALALPVQAQDAPPAGEGLLLLMERLLRDFITEAEPQLREFERGLTEIEPELNELLDRMRDLTRYHPPEILPNGDILIRRRQPEEGAPEEDVPPEPQDAPADPFEL
ncbi:hypothetical protein [Roseinatronobacter sp.]|uniref:hypothetical protein n=1 Tax=Roseinatronobacter sp. TaxID=1945755 RepID=UPI0025F08F85|nr:hypothetical protein [Roseibaca sp.]